MATRNDIAFVALIVMVVVEVTNLSAVVAAYAAVPVFHVSLLFGVLALGFALTDPAARHRLNRWTVLGVALIATYIGGQVVATLGGIDLNASTQALWRAGIDAGYVLVVLMLAQVTARPWAMAAAIVVPMAVLSLLTVVSAVALHGSTFGGFATITDASGELVTTQRYGGPFPDSNLWGRHLALAMPLAWALVHRDWRSDLRGRALFWAAVTGALFAGAYMTQSRGTLLTIAVAAVVWLVIAGMPAKIALLIPAMAAALLVPGIGNRLIALVGDLSGGSHGVDPSVLGRKASQEIAWAMFEQRPLFGSGPGTFADAIPVYSGTVPTVVRDPIIAPHNLYAQLAAETGWFGLITWAVMVGGFLAILGLRIAGRPGRDRVLVAAVFTGILAWSLASVFLHLAYFRVFGIVLALACALAPPAAVDRDTVRRLVAAPARWTGVIAIGAVAAGAVLYVSREPAVTASETVTITPVGPRDGYYAYALDIRSRVELLPTVAEIMSDGPADGSIVDDPIRGTITLRVTADDPARARIELADLVDQARARLVEFIGWQQYSVVRLTDPVVTHVTTRPVWAMPAALATGAASSAMLVALLTAGAARRRRQPRQGADADLAHSGGDTDAESDDTTNAALQGAAS